MGERKWWKSQRAEPPGSKRLQRTLIVLADIVPAVIAAEEADAGLD